MNMDDLWERAVREAGRPTGRAVPTRTPGRRVDISSAGSEPIATRRGNKNRSGRQGRKTWNGQRTLQRVGGYANEMRAVSAPADKDLCVVVPSDTGFVDGVPFRSPGSKR